MEQQENRIRIIEKMAEDGHIIRGYDVYGALQSATYVEDDLKYELYFNYMRKFNSCFSLNPDITRILMIGGAGYSYPKYVISHYPEVSIDVVDNDPQSEKLAREHFFLQDLYDEFDLKNTKRLRTVITEGQDYLARTNVKYDVIIDDAFNYIVPALDLMIYESLLDIRDCLKRKGMVMFNLPADSDYRKTEYFTRFLSTLQAVFSNVLIIPAFNNPDDDIGNYVIIASDYYEALPQAIVHHPDNKPVYTEEDLQQLADDFSRFIMI